MGRYDYTDAEALVNDTLRVIKNHAVYSCRYGPIEPVFTFRVDVAKGAKAYRREYAVNAAEFLRISRDDVAGSVVHFCEHLKNRLWEHMIDDQARRS